VPGIRLAPQLGKAHHHGYLVEDIEATVGRLVEQLGAGPFFLIENVPLENIRSGGEAAEFIHNSAFGYCGDDPLELIETVHLAPDRVEKAFSGPRPRVHHVAYAVPRAEVEALRGELDRRGLPTYLSAQLGEVENTFHDASASLGHDVEIQVDSAEFRAFFEMVRGGAEDWDGSDPLRPVGV
jgi:methylmalonyl-CoA/ethylmalonyl-CoA epimerase